VFWLLPSGRVEEVFYKKAWEAHHFSCY
jgi:hypothetical protein